MAKTKVSEGLGSILRRYAVCKDALVWADDKPLQAAYESCKRGDWLLWIAFKIIGNTRDTVAGRKLWLARADCAAISLSIYEKRYPGDKRVRECIQGVRDYANGKIDGVRLAELRRASYATAYAAGGVAAYAAAADAAAYAAAYAAAADAHDKALAKCANIVRKHLPWKMIYAAFKESVNAQAEAACQGD